MDTRLLRPKGMNGLKIRSSTRLLVQINLPTRHQPSCRRLQHLLEGLESLESRLKTEARLVLEVSAGWASSSSHVLGWRRYESRLGETHMPPHRARQLRCERV
jgi:hypothetical protein